MEDNRQIKIGAVLAYGTIAFNILAGLIYTPWMIREIGQSDYGIYGLATSLIAMFSADFGLGSAATRFLSKYKAQNDEKKISQFMGVTLKLYLILDIIILGILCICFFFLSDIYQGLTNNEVIKLRVVFVISGLFTTISFPFQPLNGMIVASERFIFQKVVDFINKFVTVVVMILLLCNGFGLYALVIVNAVVGLLVIVLKLLYMKKNFPIRIEWKYWNKELLCEIFGFSMWATVCALAQNMIFNIMPTILGATSNTIEISKFTAASTMEGYVYTFTSVISGMFMPKMARMIYKNDDNELAGSQEITALMIKVGRVQLAIVGAIISIFAALGSGFVKLWLGDGFEGTFEVILLMIVPTAIVAVEGIAETYIAVVGKMRYNTYGTLITALFSIIISLILSREFGSIGVGIAIFIGNFMGRIIMMNIIYVKKFKLDIMLFIKECFIKMSIPIVCTFCVTFFMEYICKSKSWFILGGKAFVSVAVYSVLMWLLALKKQEKELFKQPLKVIYKKLLERRGR